MIAANRPYHLATGNPAWAEQGRVVAIYGRIRHTRRMMRRSLFALLVLVVLTAMYQPPLYHGPLSDHFDGERFFNPVPMENGLAELIRWRLNADAEPWPASVPVEQQRPTSARVPQGRLRATFIGHGTVLLQLDGLNIITDPIYAQRATPFFFMGPQRVRQPGVAFEDLPPIDLVLISHNHYDHLDLDTLKRLKRRDNPLILTGLGNDAWLRRRGFDRVTGLDWHQQLQYRGLTLAFTPNQHWSARGLTDRCKTLWGGFVIEASRHRVYFAGDTGYGEFFTDLGRRYGSFDLALLPIGAFLPRWFMRYQHINPEEAVQAHRDLRARRSMAIHFGTFALADDGIDEPVRQLQEALDQGQISAEDFPVPAFGASYSIEPRAAENHRLPVRTEVQLGRTGTD